MLGKNNPSMRRGAPRAFLPGGFAPCKLPFFMFLGTFWRGKSVEAAGPNELPKVKHPNFRNRSPDSNNQKMEVGNSESEFQLPEIRIRLPISTS